MNVAQVAISDATINRLRFRAVAGNTSGDNVVLMSEERPLPWWTLISEEVLSRDWDNDDDAIYDNWRELYGVPAR
jgi:hypothetical protein